MLTKTLDAIRAGTHGEESFFLSLEKKYAASRDEIISAVEKLGLIKGRLRTYFEVERYLIAKDLTGILGLQKEYV